MSYRELQVQRFDRGAWAPTPAAGRTSPALVRVATWNTWFGEHRFVQRAEALAATLAGLDVDVIALQEVTAPLLEVLLSEAWVQAGYAVSDVDGRTFERYGVVLLSRLPVVRADLLELPSTMGRRLLTVELACGLTVSTVHLESLGESAAERAEQLGIVQPFLTSVSDDVALVGDMNFEPGAELEEAALDPSFADVWPTLRDDPGFTADSEVNSMRFLAKGRASQKRIDRVFLRSDRWCATSIELLGTEAIDDDGTWVSDHFGLLTTLEPRES